jgi:hypothetical protein
VTLPLTLDGRSPEGAMGANDIPSGCFAQSSTRAKSRDMQHGADALGAVDDEGALPCWGCGRPAHLWPVGGWAIARRGEGKRGAGLPPTARTVTAIEFWRGTGRRNDGMQGSSYGRAGRKTRAAVPDLLSPCPRVLSESSDK